MRVLAIVVTFCALLSVGCNSEKPDETPNYDVGIEAYKRGHYAVALSNFESRVMKDENDFVAQFCLGFMYDQRQVPLPEGEKAEWYKENAEKWYTKSAEHDYVPAQNNLAVMYFRRYEEMDSKIEAMGWPLDLVDEALKNLDTAVQWFGKPDAQTHYIPQYNIAFLHYNGARLINTSTLPDKSGKVKESYKHAVYWFTKAAEQDDHRAQRELADRYYYGDGVDENLTEAERWKEAVKWYEKAADNGNAAAQYALADRYYYGDGVDENLTEAERWKEAVKWYTKAAENGNVDAQYALAKMYKNGKGVDKNLTEAVKWYTKAADNGYASAQNDLGMMYNKGQGVHKNLEKATRLYFQAAQQGQIVAQANVGKSFAEGANGVPQDNEEAYYWYSLALRDPIELGKLAGKNTAADVTKRHKDVETEWRKDVGNEIEEKKKKIQERVDNWKPKELIAYGTGFYIDKNHILTNAHVASWEDPDGNKRKYDELRVDFRYVVEKPGAKSIDHDVDLALLFDENENMYTATFRNNPVYIGEKIASFGYPLSFTWLSYEGNATSGDVSGLVGPIRNNDPRNLFQHTAPIQSGNSGGPVFDSDGNVVGISVSRFFGYEFENIGFAIQFEAIQKFLNDNSIDVNSVSKDIEDLGKVIVVNKISTKAERFTKPVWCFKNITPNKTNLVKKMGIDYWKF